jgi:iron complex outermembrane recepter protein
MLMSKRTGASRAAFLASVLAIGPAIPVHAQDAPTTNLLDMSIEDLLSMEVTSASRKKQSLAQTAAAVFVITRDDIRRTGAQSVPEALRLAPGLQVAQIDANKWAIGSRGFNGRFANKLLVLMDGRTLYTPSFSGVLWDVQDTLLEDVERIEVIRGPGGTLWGSNAVNGVINIITRDSRESQGGVVSATLGERQAASAFARFGGTTEGGIGYRAFAKYGSGAENEDMSGVATADDWRQSRVGLRADWDANDNQTFSVNSEAYKGTSGETLHLPSVMPPYSLRSNSEQNVSGAFVRGQWERIGAPGVETSAQIYYDATRRDTSIFGEDRDTLDLEIQHRFPLGARHDVIAGVAYRHDSFQIKQSEHVQVVPATPSNTRLSAFVQDEIALLPNLALTLGTKIERNELSENDVDLLPNARLNWAVNERDDLWAAVTSALRTPSYADRGATITGLGAGAVIPPGTPQNPFPVPIQAQVTGSQATVSERLVAYEAGYRGRFTQRVSVDLSVFLNDYSKLRDNNAAGLYCDSTGEPLNPFAPPPACLFTSTSIINRLVFGSGQEVRTHGAELAIDWRAVDWLRVTGTYSYLHAQLRTPFSRLTQPVVGSNPDDQFSLRGEFAVGRKLDLDLWVRYVGRLPALDIDGYWSTDLHAVWRPRDRLEVSLTAQNVLGDARLEWVSELGDIVPTRIRGKMNATVHWSF